MKAKVLNPGLSINGLHFIKSDWNHIYPRWLSQSFNLVKTICKDIAEKFFNSENISLSKRIVIIQNSPIPFLNGISINAP